MLIERKPLIEVFGARPGRLDLLYKGLDFINVNEKFKVLEIGCSIGEAAVKVYEKCKCNVTAADISEALIKEAENKCNHKGNVEFIVADAEYMPFENNSFDLVFSEAAFSLLKNKENAVKEYYRVLKNNGYVLINDFITRKKASKVIQDKMSFIPCFAGVKQTDEYIGYFQEQGFELLASSDESKEIIKTAWWISKQYNYSINSLDELFAEFLGGQDTKVTDSEMCGSFFKSAQLGYAQLIFRKGGD